MRRSIGRTVVAALFMAVLGGLARADDLPDIRDVPADLAVPPMTEGLPAPGKRVKHTIAEYQHTEVYEALYLPDDWQPGKRYPVIVEYAGNGPYNNRFGDASPGRPEGSNLGYGMSAGRGFIWICMPYVSSDHTHNETRWWGDLEATVDYCKRAVRCVCGQFGGDPAVVILVGFSRGAIACNYIGLHDDEIAGLWLAFVAHSHYDGVRKWPYEGSDRAAAEQRLKRLRGRPQFISQEGSVGQTQDFLEDHAAEGKFTFQPLAFRNHTDTWVLRDVPERKALRQWLDQVLKQTKP